MPVKLRHPKARQHRVTDEAVEAWTLALAGQDTYLACIRDEACQSRVMSRHCPVCAGHIEARNRLHRALGLRLWQPSPLDADTDEPPRWAGRHDAWREGWPLARELRLALHGGDEPPKPWDG